MKKKRYRFGTKRRDSVWARECLAAYMVGRGKVPICVHCDHPVQPGDSWDEAHVGVPKALGGRSTGVGHRPCNQRDNNLVVTPAVARAKRRAAKAAGKKGPGLGRHPMRAGRLSHLTKTFRHGVQPRMTNAQKHARMLRRRAIVPEVQP